MLLCPSEPFRGSRSHHPPLCSVTPGRAEGVAAPPPLPRSHASRPGHRLSRSAERGRPLPGQPPAPAARPRPGSGPRRARPRVARELLTHGPVPSFSPSLFLPVGSAARARSADTAGPELAHPDCPSPFSVPRQRCGLRSGEGGTPPAAIALGWRRAGSACCTSSHRARLAPPRPCSERARPGAGAGPRLAVAAGERQWGLAVRTAQAVRGLCTYCLLTAHSLEPSALSRVSVPALLRRAAQGASA